MHYIPSKKVEIILHPRLIYAGDLTRSNRWRESPHSHSFLAVLFLRSGSGTVFMDSAETSVAAGDVIIYNAGLPHYEVSSPDDPLETYFFAVADVKLEDLPENHLVGDGECGVIHTGDNADMFAFYFSNLVKESHKEAHFAREMAESLTRMILLHILRILAIGNDRYIKINPMYFKAKAYIDEYFPRINSVEDVCKAVYVSNYYLTHLFSLYGDKTPLQYIIQKKMELAKKLLKSTDLPICDVALNCGYENANYFCKVFKSHEKMTPQTYRNERDAAQE
jgi:AraC-like DNA-binding protein